MRTLNKTLFAVFTLAASMSLPAQITQAPKAKTPICTSCTLNNTEQRQGDIDHSTSTQQNPLSNTNGGNIKSNLNQDLITTQNADQQTSSYAQGFGGQATGGQATGNVQNGAPVTATSGVGLNNQGNSSAKTGASKSTSGAASTVGDTTAQGYGGQGGNGGTGGQGGNGTGTGGNAGITGNSLGATSVDASDRSETNNVNNTRVDARTFVQAPILSNTQAGVVAGSQVMVVVDRECGPKQVVVRTPIEVTVIGFLGRKSTYISGYTESLAPYIKDGVVQSYRRESLQLITGQKGYRLFGTRLTTLATTTASSSAANFGAAGQSGGWTGGQGGLGRGLGASQQSEHLIDRECHYADLVDKPVEVAPAPVAIPVPQPTPAPQPSAPPAPPAKAPVKPKAKRKPVVNPCGPNEKQVTTRACIIDSKVPAQDWGMHVKN